MLHVHQTLFHSLFTLAQLRGGAVNSEKQRHVLENISGIFPQISSTRRINIDVSPISWLWVLSFMSPVVWRKWRSQFTRAAGGLCYGSQVTWCFARILTHLNIHVLKCLDYQCVRPHTSTNTHAKAQMTYAMYTPLLSQPFFTSLSLRLSLRLFYHLANINISVIKTITE